jgi:hypothetical protein
MFYTCFHEDLEVFNRSVDKEARRNFLRKSLAIRVQLFPQLLWQLETN